MRSRNKLILWMIPGLLMVFPLCATGASGTTDTAAETGKHLEQAIEIRQQAQRSRTRWETEKSELVLQYEQLLEKNKVLKVENENLAAQEERLNAQTQALVRQKAESIRVQRELGPFLDTLYGQLETLIKNDTPFLEDERTRRLAALRQMRKDPEITMSEKYRKVMEALFIEAEYGTTIELYQEKIKFSQSDVDGTLGDIFRLGRVSLFFLSLDRTRCAVFNPGTRQWEVLPEQMLPSIVSAVEIAAKRRPAELLSLPIGRLASQGGDQ